MSPEKGSAFQVGRLMPVVVIGLIQLLLAFSFLLSEVTGSVAPLAGFPLDDSWIHMVYGRSLAATGVPEYNEGEPEAGFTSPLWMFSIALAHRLSADTVNRVLWVKFLGLLANMAAALVVFGLLRRITDSRASAALGALLVSLDPWLLFASLSGMETTLAGALLVGAVALAYQERYRAVGLISAAAFLARPELALLAPLFAAFFVVPKGLTIRQRGVRFLWVLGPTLFVGLGWVAYCLQVSGQPLPNTFFAKFSTGRGEGLRAILWGAIGQRAFFSWGGAWVLLLLGWRSIRGRWRRYGILWSPLILLVLATAWSRKLAVAQMDYYYWLRYGLPLLPLLYLLVAVGFHALRGATGSWKKPYQRITVGLVLVWLLAPWHSDWRARREQFAWNCQNIEEVQVDLGRWAKEHTEPGEALMVNDAGALRYFSDRPVVDLVGLNDYRILFSPERRLLRQSPQVLAALGEERGAPWLIVFPSWFREAMEDPTFSIYYRPVISAKSDPYTVVPVPGQAEKVVFRLIDPSE